MLLQLLSVANLAAEKAVEPVGEQHHLLFDRLRDLGVKTEQLRPFAEKAYQVKRILRVNPRAVTVEDLEGILKEAY